MVADKIVIKPIIFLGYRVSAREGDQEGEEKNRHLFCIAAEDERLYL